MSYNSQPRGKKSLTTNMEIFYFFSIMAVKAKKKSLVEKKVHSVKKIKRQKDVFKINRGSSATSSQSNKKSSARKKIKSRKSIASSQKKSSDIRSVGKKKIKVLPKKKGKLEETVKKEKIKKTSDLNVVDKRKIQELKKELKNLDKKDEIPIKDAEGRLYCYDENCDQPAVTDIYCRYHYLALWQYLRIRKQLLESKYLVTTIQEILASCGEGALHFLLRDLKSEKTFELATKEMNFSLGREGETLKSETDFDS